MNPPGKRRLPGGGRLNAKAEVACDELRKSLKLGCQIIPYCSVPCLMALLDVAQTIDAETILRHGLVELGNGPKTELVDNVMEVAR